jgi:hypothetical protein
MTTAETVQRIDAFAKTVATLGAIKNPSTRLRRQLAKTRRRLHVWRRRLNNGVSHGR